MTLSRIGTPSPPVFEGSVQLIFRFPETESTVVDGGEGFSGLLAASIEMTGDGAESPTMLFALH